MVDSSADRLDNDGNLDHPKETIDRQQKQWAPSDNNIINKSNINHNDQTLKQSVANTTAQQHPIQATKPFCSKIPPTIDGGGVTAHTGTLGKFKKLFKFRLGSLSSKYELPANIQVIGRLPPTDKIEKRPLSAEEKRQSDEEEDDVDCGYAWVILAVMFVINASTFGTARAYGLIFEKLAREGEQSRTQAALPFTIMGAVENMSGPLAGLILAIACSWRTTVFMGTCLISASHLLAASFRSLSGQVATMGFMCGLGLSMVSVSWFQINNAYFVRYRSRAFGLGLTGAVFGTFYITPLCQYVLDNSTTNDCYFVLGLILLPNVPLSLLLKPKITPPKEMIDVEICTISAQLDQAKKRKKSIYQSIKQVVNTPLFHMIWLTQMLFCWLNFSFGFILVDFGIDRGLNSARVSQLVPIWASGQLIGRLVLGSVVDLKFISYRFCTVICFASIAIATWSLNNIRSENHDCMLISLLVFVLAVFISNLYILFNSLMSCIRADTALSIGISSFTSGIFLLPRATIIGYYRDTTGSYDSMLDVFSYVSMTAALVWLLLPPLCSRLRPIFSWLMTSGGNKTSMVDSPSLKLALGQRQQQQLSVSS